MTTNGSETKGTALITGASAGIGEQFAKRLAGQGYGLVLVARRRERLEALAAELGAKHGVKVEVLTADLASAEGLANVAERLGAGDITLLINNAGFGTFGEFAELPIEREMEEVDLNVRALVRLSHAALASMAPQKRGGIINVASTAAFQPLPYNAIYGATKAFVLSFSEGIHEEAKAHGVSVTCLCPGPVKTEFQEVAGVDPLGVPAMAWQSVESVVDAALSALRSGRAIVIPGTLNYVLANSPRMMPRFLIRRITANVMRDRGRKG
jgi:short-subunit dehydrogenase